jgi:hypothetical protein
LGYDIHITRAHEWTESAKSPISIEEWLNYVASDPEMRLDNFAEATTTAGDVIRHEALGIAVWIAYPRNGIDGRMGWFHHWRGEVRVKNPDDEILDKMRRIAAFFGARVLGDEGELY